MQELRGHGRRSLGDRRARLRGRARLRALRLLRRRTRWRTLRLLWRWRGLSLRYRRARLRNGLCRLVYEWLRGTCVASLGNRRTALGNRLGLLLVYDGLSYLCVSALGHSRATLWNLRRRLPYEWLADRPVLRARLRRRCRAHVRRYVSRPLRHGPLGCSLGRRRRTRRGGTVIRRKRTSRRKHCRARMTRGSKLRAVRGSLPRVLNLRGHRAAARIMRHGQLLRRRPRTDAAAAAVITYEIVTMARNRVVVDIILNHWRVDVGHIAVVVQPVVIPERAIEAAPGIAEAVIDVTIEADVRAPETGMKDVDSAGKSPPGRRPERAHPRGQHPGPRNPVVSGVESGR